MNCPIFGEAYTFIVCLFNIKFICKQLIFKYLKKIKFCYL